MGGGTSVDGNCDAGYVCPLGAAVSNPGGGTIFDFTSPMISGLCPEGHACVSGSYYPVPCSEGTYQHQTGQSICLSCPAGKYCDKLAITSAEIAVRDCAAGHYCPGSTKVEKPIKTSQNGKLCSSQFYCPTGTVSELSCPPGYYDDRKGLAVC